MKPILIRIDNRVYNVDSFASRHPGGIEVLQAYTGGDINAADVFTAYHTHATRSAFLKTLPSTEYPQTLMRNKKHESYDSAIYNELREELQKAGCYKTLPFWFLQKQVELIVLVIAGIWIATYTASLGGAIVGAFGLGLAWQQAGWLGHDLSHHSVYPDHQRNTTAWFFSLVWACFFNGFSVRWWRDRHNAHHVMTNVEDRDPDIDNAPLFAWSASDVRRASKFQRTYFLPYQHYIFYPFISTLTLIWNLQSMMFAFQCKGHTNVWYRNTYTTELTWLIAHWLGVVAIFTYVAVQTASLNIALVFILTAKLIAGAGIAWVVFLNHYPMEQQPLVESSLAHNTTHTTRNVQPSMVVDWLFGGLNYQIEHHMFPTMPRENLAKASKIVSKWCVDHKYPYDSQPWYTAMGLLYQRLKEISSLGK